MSAPASAPRAGLLLFMVEIDPTCETEFNRWYNEEHLPERAFCPGFRSARRFKAVDGTPLYLAIYDLDSPGVMDGPGYNAIKGPTAWTQRMRHCYRKVHRHVFEEVFSAEDLPGYAAHKAAHPRTRREDAGA